MYRGYGFRECTGTATRFDARFGTAISCLHLRPEWMPPEVNPPRGAGRAIHAHGRRLPVRVLPSLPAASAVPSPYETGDFRGSDIFCPLRATEVRAARDLETGATRRAPQPEAGAKG